MISFAVPFSDLRVDIHRTRDKIPHVSSPTHPHPHGEDELRDLAVWFAYIDEADKTARAVCPEFSLVIERPTIQEAALETERVLAGLIDDAATDEDSVPARRVLPKELIVEHLNRFTKMLERRPEQRGTAWKSGHRHMTLEQVPAQTP
jgi:hypothetical protein